jgi:hypothetical protein
MLHMMPRGIPPFGQLWEAVQRPHPSSLATALDVDVRTVYRWMDKDQAPRCAGLALWWLTPWGRSLLVCDAEQRISLAEATAKAVACELAQSRTELERARAMAEHYARHEPRAQAANAARLR